MADNQAPIYLISVTERRIEDGATRLTFRTNRGEFDAIANLVPGSRRGVVMLGGYEGGFDGPGQVYPQLARDLRSRGITSLRLDYRVPGDCAQCGVDTLVALQYLDDESAREVVLIGWSFGAAVAIAAGAVAKTVEGVAAVSTVSTGCNGKWLKTKPILLIHGDSDTQSPLDVPRAVYAEAGRRRKLLIYPQAGHDLAGSQERLRQDLLSWITSILGLDLAA